MTVEPQPAGPTFARSARVNGTCTTYERIYIYIYKKHGLYIYIYDEDFSQLYDKCGARAARQLLVLAMGRHGFPGIPRRFGMQLPLVAMVCARHLR